MIYLLSQPLSRVEFTTFMRGLKKIVRVMQIGYILLYILCISPARKTKEFSDWPKDMFFGERKKKRATPGKEFPTLS